MKAPAKFIWVTGTDTGVGKTVVATAVVRGLLLDGYDVLGVKPFCSGGTGDVEAMVRAMGGGEEPRRVTPWVFREPLAPLVAARRAGRRISRAEVLRFLRESARGRDRVVVEGAGGLLSPLGEGFDARDLMRALQASIERVVVVVANRLGAMNQASLVVEALGRPFRARVRIALVSPPRSTVVSRTNLSFLQERWGADRVLAFPWLADPDGRRGDDPRVRGAVDRLLA